jgi:hypothetical protein
MELLTIQRFIVIRRDTLNGHRCLSTQFVITYCYTVQIIAAWVSQLLSYRRQQLMPWALKDEGCQEHLWQYANNGDAVRVSKM